MTATIVKPPTFAILSACDALDGAVGEFLFARNSLAGTRYEADTEARYLSNLVARHVEGVLTLARTDLVLLPPALACARAAFETAVKAAWLVDADDHFVREARWLVHLEEEERAHERSAARKDDLPSAAGIREQSLQIRAFRAQVAQRMPKHVQLLKRNPSFDEMLKGLGAGEAYPLYIYLSQFMHGGHMSTGLYRKGLGTSKEGGEFISASHWYVALRACWLSLSYPGKLLIERIKGAATTYPKPKQVAAVEAAIDAVRDTDPDRTH